MRKILLKSMLIAGMLAVGMNVQAKVDITDTYLTNADLQSLDGWEYGDDFNGGTFNYTDWNVNMDVPVIEFYHSWTGNANQVGQAIGTTKNFHFTQTITLPAGDYRIAVNALYREGNGNGTNTKAYIFAGEKEQFVYGITGAENNEIVRAGQNEALVHSDMGGAAYLFSQGRFSNEFDFTLTSEQEIEIGFRGYIDTYCSWCILGPVKLYQYEFADYVADYNEKVTEAEGLYGESMSESVLNALKAAVKDPSTFTTSEEVTAALQELTEAINAAKQNMIMLEEASGLIGQAMSATASANLEAALNGTNEELGEAINEAKNSISVYQAISNVLDTFEMNGMDVSSVRNQYENGTLETVEEVYPMIQQAAIASLGTGSDTDYTPAIINPSFEFGNTTGWTYATSGDHGAKPVSNDTYFVDNADGDYVFNIWSSGNAISQTIEGLPNGLYMMSALIATDGGHQVKLFANEEETIVDAAPEATDEELAEGLYGGKKHGVIGKVLVNVTGGSLTIGAEGVNKYWYKVDDFHLTYKPDASEVIGDKIDEANEVLSKKMSATAKANLENALSNVSSDPMQAIEDINEALTAAKASVAVYEQINNAIQKIMELDPEVDVFDMQDAYDEGEYETLEDIYPLYHAAKIALLPKEDDTDYTSAIINPSFEFGDAFGWTYQPSNDSGVKSNAQMPYTIDIADGEYVFNIWRSGNPITQTIVGLPNGEYELNAVIASTSNEEGTYTVKLFANDVEVLVEAAPEGENFGNIGTLNVTVTDGTLTIGAMGGGEWVDENTGDVWPTWYKVDDFHLTLEKVSGGVPGDINGDGNVNSADVQKVYSLMAQSATGATNPEADINNDGQVNSADIQKIYGIMATSPAK